MTADIQAAKERQEALDWLQRKTTDGPYSERMVGWIQAEFSRLEGENERLRKVVRISAVLEGDLAEARRQVAERDAALTEIASGKQTLTRCIITARKSLLASPPSGVAETFSPEAKRQAWSLLEQAVEGLAPTNNVGSDA